MKNKNAVLIISGILLLAFITNPKKQRHVEKASEVITEYLASEGEADLFTVAMGSLVGVIVGYKMEVDNYLFFTTSSIRSKQRGKTLLCGVGLFGQVVWVASKKDIEDFTSDHEEKDLLKSPSKSKQQTDMEEIDPALRSIFSD